MLKPGDRAADFDATDQNGTRHQLSVLLEKSPVVSDLFLGGHMELINKVLTRTESS